ncbi:MAG: hemolysin III family protein [Candidatus Marinimicrobia bacterium]|nr:hemolysin III family protein [Candidatus Neomarinimicrobiota bacterium]
MKNANPAIDRSVPAFTIGRVSRFTPQEEVANAVSHILGTVLSVYALVLLLTYSIKSGEVSNIVGASIFGISMLALYLFSALTHSLPTGRAKDIFHNLDQIAIYLLIAGTYTPFALMLKGDWGLFILGIEWVLALSGIAMKLLMPGIFERGVNILIITSYVIMGWLLIFFMAPLQRHLDPSGIYLIFLGGAFYTLGIFFFKAKNIKYSHLIWHIMVMAGSVIYWWVIMKYVINA